MSTFVVNAEARDDMGKGASRRLRHQGMVPAVIYGADKDPVAISVNHNEMAKHLEEEAFYSHILTIKTPAGDEKAILKDLQRHPAKPILLHADFLRIDEKTKLRVNVPVHFVGEDVAPGVKAGGVLTRNLNEVEVQCLPKDLPEYIEADVSTMEMGDSVHLTELKLPAGVEILELLHGEGHDQAVATIASTRASLETEETEEAEGESEEEGGEE
ncbi:MAG: 50S ribosomal protein L25/general stress protein Ctc [Gammaproteobacteria bacterium]|nr:50S ribosomal protein L25/general stress protein Ctc [Gammaproteobacteria bacterium]